MARPLLDLERRSRHAGLRQRSRSSRVELRVAIFAADARDRDVPFRRRHKGVALGIELI
jgi:hypothetical protein